MILFKISKINFIWKIRLRVYYFRKYIREKIFVEKVVRFTRGVEGVEFREEGEFLNKNGLMVFPYPFSKKYSVENIEVFYENGYPYVIYFGKKLFYPENYKIPRIRECARSILMEQDPKSPHRYATNLFKIDDGDVLFDIGCAEGNFSLEHVEKLKSIHLFELNHKWVKAIKKTFFPWDSKVKLHLERLGSSKSSLDPCELISSEENSIIIKIDVDGAEREVLSSIRPLLMQNRKIKVAICTYHFNDDANDFETYFQNLGYSTSFSPGFMLFYHDRSLSKPFFRRGVLFACKN